MSTEIAICDISFITQMTDNRGNIKPSNNAVDPDWFDATKSLGKKGHRYYSQSCKYALAAMQSLKIAEQAAPNKRGVFIGTNTIDIQTRSEIIENIQNHPEEMPISAAYAPNSSANIVAGVIAEKYKLNGHSYTFTGSEDAALMALWHTLKALLRDDINSSITGQTEHLTNHQEEGGAILWSLTTCELSNHLTTILPICMCRWQISNNVTPDIQLDDIGDESVFLIARDNSTTQRLTEVLNNAAIHFEIIDINQDGREICSDMQLFSALSLLVIKQALGRVLLVSNCGHIFHFQLKQ